MQSDIRRYKNGVYRGMCAVHELLQKCDILHLNVEGYGSHTLFEQLSAAGAASWVMQVRAIQLQSRHKLYKPHKLHAATLRRLHLTPTTGADIATLTAWLPALLSLWWSPLGVHMLPMAPGVPAVDINDSVQVALPLVCNTLYQQFRMLELTCIHILLYVTVRVQDVSKMLRRQMCHVVYSTQPRFDAYTWIESDVVSLAQQRSLLRVTDCTRCSVSSDGCVHGSRLATALMARNAVALDLNKFQLVSMARVTAVLVHLLVNCDTHLACVNRQKQNVWDLLVQHDTVSIVRRALAQSRTTRKRNARRTNDMHRGVCSSHCCMQRCGDVCFRARHTKLHREYQSTAKRTRIIKLVINHLCAFGEPNVHAVDAQHRNLENLLDGVYHSEHPAG
jgi:hypothetical protein